MESTHNEKRCSAYEEHLRGLTDELNALFTTGTGRRTPEHQTMLNPHKSSGCEARICTIHQLQIYTDNA